ncbi:RNA-binding domain-containing protein [Lophiostoma macrostomum CBS 122681]|uniref:RNA-binding domain-containing protein n=1 Tax=Lophiostoma macrostomum CBS 122681 TaxID=1314788 RepID=A0A6A6TTU8_9PLEO|nr:RNA-binding domain-containing protein [Lophiostoma macrostomum CBS 122681]
MRYTRASRADQGVLRCAPCTKKPKKGSATGNPFFTPDPNTFPPSAAKHRPLSIMFLLRRTAARALSSTPSKSFLAQPRSIATYTPAFRSRQSQCVVNLFQRRFASDDVAKSESAESAAATAESFAQTVPKAPVEENLTPAQEAAQSSPTDASGAAGVDALDAAARGDSRGRIAGRRLEALKPAPPSKVVYVGNLYYEVTEDQLKRVFSRFGAIESVRVVFDNRGMSRGFGYVEYSNTDDAQTAIDNLDMQVFEGRNLVVQFHRPRPDAPVRGARGEFTPSTPSKTLFIGNMSFEMSDKDLNDLFRDIRNVVDVRVAIDRRTGQPRGFAHADFLDVASATRARDVLKEKVIYGRQLRIDYSKSTANGGRDRRTEDTVSLDPVS